ncbi:MAG: hypothetical protein V9F00_14655 [Nocardioides sp.]
MLAGLQGAGKTTLAGQARRCGSRSRAQSPLLVAADLQRPNAVNQLQVVGEQRRRPGLRSRARQRRRRPGRRWREASHRARPSASSTTSVIVDTAGRLGVDAELMQQAADIRDAVQPRRDPVRRRRDDRPGRRQHRATPSPEGVGFDGVVLTKLDGDARGGAALSIATVTGKPIMFASNGEKLDRLRRLPPRPDGLAASSTWATCSP